MYTEEMLMKRNKLKVDPEIQKTINDVLMLYSYDKFMENYKFEGKKLLKSEYFKI